jgi:hypothetical protein
MLEGSAVPLTVEQQEFLDRVVTNYSSGIHSSFFFAQSQTRTTLTYRDALMRFAPTIDELDLKQLSQAGLITLENVGTPGTHLYKGKPTAAALARVTALTEFPENGTGSIGNATAAVPAAVGLAVSGAAKSRDPKGAARRPRGFPANAHDHYKVAEVICKIGADWSSRLPEVCQQLQKVGAEFTKALRDQERVETWDEIAEDMLGPGNSSRRERAAKYIKHRIGWAARNPPA